MLFHVDIFKHLNLFYLSFLGLIRILNVWIRPIWGTPLTFFLFFLILLHFFLFSPHIPVKFILGTLLSISLILSYFLCVSFYKVSKFISSLFRYVLSAVNISVYFLDLSLNIYILNILFQVFNCYQFLYECFSFIFILHKYYIFIYHWEFYFCYPHLSVPVFCCLCSVCIVLSLSVYMTFFVAGHCY